MENGSFEDAFPIQHEGYSIAILVYQRVSENKNYKPNIAMENRSFEDAFPIKHGGYAILVNQKGKWKHENPQNSLHSTCCNISSRSQVPHVSPVFCQSRFSADWGQGTDQHPKDHCSVFSTSFLWSPWASRRLRVSWRASTQMYHNVLSKCASKCW